MIECEYLIKHRRSERWQLSIRCKLPKLFLHMLAITRMKNFLIQQIIDPASAGSAGPALTPLGEH